MIPPAELGELEAFRSLIGGWNEGRVAEIGGALCTAVAAAPSSALLNRALGLGLGPPAREAVLAEIDRFFQTWAWSTASPSPLTPSPQT